MNRQTAVIIGAGPAGLTAALELERRTGIRPIVIEATDAIGGISRTIRYKGNRMDIGGHRFFSKSDRVMQWWLDLMPVEAAACGLGLVSSHGQRREVPVAAMAPAQSDLVMLVRPRKSRIYFLRRFFDYPIRLTAATLKKMGVSRTIRSGISYMRAALFPIGKWREKRRGWGQGSRLAVAASLDGVRDELGQLLRLSALEVPCEEGNGFPCCLLGKIVDLAQKVMHGVCCREWIHRSPGHDLSLGADGPREGVLHARSRGLGPGDGGSGEFRVLRGVVVAHLLDGQSGQVRKLQSAVRKCPGKSLGLKGHGNFSL
jgi:hypothetical protein